MPLEEAPDGGLHVEGRVVVRRQELRRLPGSARVGQMRPEQAGRQACGEDAYDARREVEGLGPHAPVIVGVPEDRGDSARHRPQEMGLLGLGELGAGHAGGEGMQHLQEVQPAGTGDKTKRRNKPGTI